MSFKIIATNGEARNGILQVNGKKLETPYLFPVMSFFCGGDWSSKFGGGIYRDIKEFLMNPSFQRFFPGVMTSIAQINDFPVKKEKFEDLYLSKTISEWFNYNGFIFVDSGGFKLLTNGGIKGIDFEIKTTDDVLKYQKKFGADIIASLDYPIHPKLKSRIKNKRINFSIKNAVFLMKNKPKDSLAYLAVHGHTEEELRFFLEKLLNGIDKNGISWNKIDGIAIGSLVPVRHDKEKIIKIIKSSKGLLKEFGLDKIPIHIFGISGNMIPILISLGVDTFDSSSYVYSAINGVYVQKALKRKNVNDVKRNCNCIVCRNDKSWKMMRSRSESLLSREKTAPLAIHNMIVLQNEVKNLKNIIKTEDEEGFNRYLLKRYSRIKNINKILRNGQNERNV